MGEADIELDVLAVGAHPDDVEIACGGTLARLARKGYQVGIVDLTDGEPTPMSPGPDVRLEEARRAAEVLGARGSLLPCFDLSARLSLTERLRLEASASGRVSPTRDSALGTAQAWALGGGGALGIELWRPGDLVVLADLGARLSAVHLSGATLTPTVVAEQHWSWQAHAALGLGIDYFLSPRAALNLRAGATLALRGVTAVAGAESPLSTSGGGGYLSLGSEAWF